MSKFKHPGRSAETVDKRSKQSGGNYDSYLNSNLSFLKVPEGRNELRILPPTWDTKGPWGDNWGIEVYIHRGIGPDKGSYLCLDEMRKKYGVKVVPERLGDCPLCAARRELEGDDEEASRALKAGKQILAYVVSRDAEREGPVVWRLGWKMEKDIQGRSSDPKTGAPIIIDDVDHGYDISFRRDGQGLKTQYLSIDVARDESPLSEKPAREQKWLDFIQDSPLTEQLVFYDADYIESVYMGKKGGKAKDEDEEDDRPTRAKRPAAKDEDEEEAPVRRRARAQDEDEEEERPRRKPARDEDEEDDRMPTDREMRGNASRARGKAKDEDEEDEPKPRRRARDEEEEDEPAPKRRRAAAEDEEEEDRPKRRPARDADEDEEDRPKRKPARDEEEEEEAPKRRRRPAEDEDEEDKPQERQRPRGKAKDEDEEDDEPPSKRSGRAASKDDDEEAEDAKPKGKSVDRAKAALGRLKGKA